LRLILNWTAPVGNQAPLWVAYDTGIFREQGLDVELTNIPATSRVIQTMVAGEVHLSPLDPATSVQASLGGADMLLLIGMSNRLPFSILTQPSIREPQALRGKSLGVTRVGASSHTAALVALDIWGLAPDRDVAFRLLGETPAIYAALQAGQVDAGVGTQPVPAQARASYHELIDLAVQGPEYASVAIGGPRAWIEANAEAVRRFARAYVLGLQRAKSDKAATLEAYRKYMQLEDPEQLEATHAYAIRNLPDVPYVSEAAMARMLEDLAREEPRLAGRLPSDWVDSRYVRELEESGFFR
jgi:NitT/TauT family transport system substrate-binding protein